MNSPSSAMKKRRNRGLGILQYVVLFVGLIALYLLLGLASGLVSDKAVERHVRQTVEQTDLKADFWFAFLYKPNYYMDNFTDALIVNQAWCLGEEDGYNLWQRVMLVPRKDGGGEGCENLRRLAEGDTTMRTVHYPRYWHGSTFLMRLLLAVDDYVVMRTLFYILSSLLLLWVVLALSKRVGVWAAVLYGLSLILVDVFMMQFSIQFLPALLIALGGSLWVLYGRNGNNGRLAMGFFVMGSLTAYFDLLTAPLLTWGVPLLVTIVVSRMDEPSARRGRQPFLTFMLCSITWGVGYGVTWVAKWLLATLTTPMNVFTDASEQASIRIAVEDYTRWEAVERNLDLVPWLYVAIAVGILLFLVVRFFRRDGWRNALLCLAVALAPVAWYLALSNHSYVHFWFTYRGLAVSVMGLFFAVASLVDWEKMRR